jgi:uncharacterized membrane protein
MTRQDASVPVENGSRRRGLVLVLVVFILGLVCGAALTIIGVRSLTPRRLAGHPDGRRGEIRRGFEHMAGELGMDEDQRRAVREVFERSRREMQEISRESGEEIREILTEEQREQFDRMRERRRSPNRRRRPGRGGRERPPSSEDLPPPPPPDDGS